MNISAIIFLILFIAIIAYNVYDYFQSLDYLCKKSLYNTKRSPISELQEGKEYLIVGKVVPIHASLESPLHKNKCVYFETRITEKRSSGKRVSDYPVLFFEDCVQFVVEDETGRAKINFRFKNNQKAHFNQFHWKHEKYPDEVWTHIKNYYNNNRAKFSDQNFETVSGNEFTINVDSNIAIYGKATKLVHAMDNGYYWEFEPCLLSNMTLQFYYAITNDLTKIKN